MKNKDEGLTSSPNDSNAPVVCCLSPTEIEEGNFLISIFNNWTYKNIKEFKKDISSKELHNYHEDLNKLISTVRKIYKMYEWDKFYYSPVVCHFYSSENIKILTGNVNDNETDEGFCGKMKYIYKPCQPDYAIWCAVVEFIKWYNQNVVSER